MRIVFVALGLVGCGFSGAAGSDMGDDLGDETTDDTTDDMSTDEAGDETTDGTGDGGVGPDACTSWSTQTDTCAISFSATIDVDEDATYNTDTHELTLIGGEVRLIAGSAQRDIAGLAGVVNVWTVESLDLLKNLRVVGSKPFGVIAPGPIRIAAIIDATSKASGAGAGARRFDACGTAAGRTPGPHANGGGAAGGSGGAFQGAGGDGGDADANEEPVDGPLGGAAIAQPDGPLGGCPGGTGGAQGNQMNGGRAGAGGGAVYLASGTAIDIASGGITAGGRGGEGGDGTSNLFDGGGGGGGSGGMIFLEAPTVAVHGPLAANGGAGGGGADSNSGAKGEDGKHGDNPANGGPGSGSSGDGATGSAGSILDGASPMGRPNSGGGGGGGGAGFIIIKTLNRTVESVLSPPGSS